MKRRLISLLLASSVFISALSINIKKKRNVMDNGIYKDIYSEHILDFSSVNVENNYYLKEDNVSDIVVLTQDNSVCVSNNLSIESVVDNIMLNSKKEPKSFFIDKNISGSKELIIRVINTVFETKSNFQEDLCLLKDVSISLGKLAAGVCATYNSKNNKIVINEDMLIENNYNSSYLFHVLMHEVNHVRQYRCKCSNKMYRSVGDLGFKFLMEASAESEIIYNESIGEEIPSYFEYRYLESTLLLMAAFKNKGTLEDYYEAIFNSDFIKLYQLFGLETKEDYESFYHILNELNSLDKEKSNVGNEVFLEIYKIVAEDIAKMIKNKDIKLIELINIITLLKGTLINLYTLDDLEFLQKLDDLEKILVLYIAKEYNTEVEFIYNLIDTNSKEFYNYFYEEKNNSLIKEYPILIEIINNTNKYFYLELLSRR